MTELWLPVVGYEGRYDVSDSGRVRSKARFVDYVDGRTGSRPELILKPTKNVRTGGRYIGMVDSAGRRKFHKLARVVLTAFIGPCPEGLESLHWDDDKDNNRLSNLRWGTRSENMFDRVRNRLHPAANQTHCRRRNHALTPENTTYTREGWRRCKTCRRDQCRASRASASATA